MVLATNLLGTDAMVRQRIRAYRDAGITTLRVEPAGATLDERIGILARLMDLVESVGKGRFFFLGRSDARGRTLT